MLMRRVATSGGYPLSLQLSAVDRALHYAKMKELYKQKHRETKKGIAQSIAAKRRLAPAIGVPSRRCDKEIKELYPPVHKTPAFADYMSTVTKETSEYIGRMAAVGKINNIEKIRATSLDRGSELQAIGRLQNISPKDVSDLMSRAEAGEKASAVKELEALRSPPVPETKPDPECVERPASA